MTLWTIGRHWAQPHPLGVCRQRLLQRNRASLQRILRRIVGGIQRPLVQVLHQHQDRHQHHAHQPDRPRHRFQRTPEQQAPLAARDVLQHQHGQPAAGEAEAEHEAKQVRAQNVVPALMRKRKEQRDDSARSRHHQCRILHAATASGESQRQPAACADRGVRVRAVRLLPRYVRVQMPCDSSLRSEASEGAT